MRDAALRFVLLVGRESFVRSYLYLHGAIGNLHRRALALLQHCTRWMKKKSKMQLSITFLCAGANSEAPPRRRVFDR